MEGWWAMLWNSFVQIHVYSETHEGSSNGIVEEAKSDLAYEEGENSNNNEWNNIAGIGCVTNVSNSPEDYSIDSCDEDHSHENEEATNLLGKVELNHVLKIDEEAIPC